MKRDKLLEEVTRLYDVAIAKWRMTSEGTISQAYYDGESNGIDLIKSLIIQLDEPEKVVVPQFVADHIELCKSKNKRLNVALSESHESKMVFEMGVSWEEANEIYARAWLDGYEIKKEQLYEVKMPTKSSTGKTIRLCYDNFSGAIWFSEWDGEDKGSFKFKFTEKEIKDYDERYWAFAKPAEGEEK